MLFSRFPLLFLAASLCLPLVSCRDGKKEDTNVIELNFGHFPNVTHVQGLVAHHFSRQGNGWFEERVKKATGKDVKINWLCVQRGAQRDGGDICPVH